MDYIMLTQNEHITSRENLREAPSDWCPQNKSEVMLQEMV